ncbi:MAG TPA: hypothetical protein VER96_31300 [Polyangiaceae bacterium]|nr:hypothetical protein [Polyangiaceae bacterium]
MSTNAASLRRMLPLLASVLCVYAASLRGGYLNWDDPWLVSQNKYFLHPTLGGLWKIWTNFSNSVRYDLGAEFLPVRDTTFWLEAVLYRPGPTFSRLFQLTLYAGALLRFREFLRVCTGKAIVADIAIWFFALHPVHVEIVAWLSARKDVLSLFFCAASLDLYSRSPERARAITLLCALASLSKASSIVLPLLLLVADLMQARRPAWRTVVGSLLIACTLGFVQMRVGQSIGMLTGFAGGSRSSAIYTEGAVLLRYLKFCVWPQGLSLIHDVIPSARWTLQTTLGFGTLLSWLTLALWSRQRILLSAWLLFVLPLLPTMNALIPIQNLMADRYIALSLMGPALVFATLVANLGDVPRWVVSGCTFASLAAISGYRANLFASSVPVLEEAVLHSPDSRRAAFQLGKAYEEVGRVDDALRAYRDASRRAAGDDEAPIRAVIALTRLEDARGNRAVAKRELEAALQRWPKDTRLRRRQRLLAPTPAAFTD